MANKKWQFELENKTHTVELSHQYLSGRKEIRLDGRLIPLPESAQSIIDFGGDYSFSIGTHLATVHIKTNGITFNYDFSIGNRSIHAVALVRKCSACGLVNFAKAANCQRCNAALAATQEHLGEQLREFARTPFSINGCGIMLLDFRPIEKCFYECSSWITFLFMPIIPLSTLTIRPNHSDGVHLGVVSAENYSYQILSKSRPKIKAILRVYAKLAIAVLPAILLYTFNNKTIKIFGVDAGLLFIFACLFWWIYIVIFKLNNKNKVFNK